MNWKDCAELQWPTQVLSTGSLPEQVETGATSQCDIMQCVPLCSSLCENLLNVVMKEFLRPAPFHHTVHSEGCVQCDETQMTDGVMAVKLLVG